MIRILDKIIKVSFSILFFLLPIIVFPLTSEIFEFNKITLVYLVTIIISCSWLAKSIISKKFTFRRTILNIPILIYIASQIIATIFSIDKYTSIFGYYSRFNGGLLSQISYVTLFFAFVNNIEKGYVKKIFTILLSSLGLVSIYGILEHYGIDKNIWVQDVQNRVFSTLGQPNWLAALIDTLAPLTWAFALITFLSDKPKSIFRKLVYPFLSALFFLTLLFTKSRSGLIGFGVELVIFWLASILIFVRKAKRKQARIILTQFFLVNLSFLILVSLVGTPWSPNISEVLNKGAEADVENQNSENQVGNILEVGGTGSGEIRKIVWKGAFNLFKAKPILGTGPETFAYSYYLYRPPEHNLISEWDFLYNKAHNEYLNYLATSGLVGTVSYVLLIAFILLSVLNIKKVNASAKFKEFYKNYKLSNLISGKSDSFLFLALFSGLISILVTNFFGFSVVVISFLLFLFPAMAIVLTYGWNNPEATSKKLNTWQKVLLPSTAIIGIFLIFLLTKYWYADILYTQGKGFNKTSKYPQARIVLFKATSLVPHQPIYWDELSQSASGLALDFFNAKDNADAETFSETAIDESNYALALSPNNLNIRKNNAAMFIKLAVLDPNLLNKAEERISATITLSPTDAKLYYNLGLVQARLGKLDASISTLEKTVELKANYRDARFALAVLYNQKGEKDKAKQQLEYILEKINPQDETAKFQLQEI